MEELLWASQGSLLVSPLWKSYFGLVRDHFGESAVEELLWASRVCCGRATGRTEVPSS